MSFRSRSFVQQPGLGDRHVLVLDPEIAGALSCRRLCGGHGRRIEGATSCSGPHRRTWRKPNITFTPRWREPPIATPHRPASEQQHLDAVAAHHRQLQVWAENCPENFENRAALVGAEIARIEGRELDAERLYEQAIRSARANGFVHNEALANELAARFYAARGFEKIARVYLHDARYGYLRWGADGKVRQLDALYPHLEGEEPAPAPTSTIGAPVEQLDIGAVIKASQAVSGEIVLDRLIETLMRIALEHAGAQRGLLILMRRETPQIEAEATTEQKMVVVTVRQEVVTQALLPNPFYTP